MNGMKGFLHLKAIIIEPEEQHAIWLGREASLFFRPYTRFVHKFDDSFSWINSDPLRQAQTAIEVSELGAMRLHLSCKPAMKPSLNVSLSTKKGLASNGSGRSLTALKQLKVTIRNGFAYVFVVDMSQSS